MAGVQASNLVSNMSRIITETHSNSPLLDLACGNGRNGLYLLELGLTVVFADRQQSKLDEVASQCQGSKRASCWAVDLEQPEGNPLAGRSFASILVFRYLHRPLMNAIRESILPGGLIVYETFTTLQAQYGRPSNPDVLQRPGEMEATFTGWELLHSFEGATLCETSGRDQAIAQIVARKPG
jgi:tellurite methyltransferase